ncbi:hypothetical protein H0H92_011550 [Tricholoma furcatifolium]|nr:hypothetical protein H0H92_011550 [Tricholoma furcatifolium]
MSAIHNAEGIFALPAPPHPGRLGLPVSNSTHSFWINTPGANPLAKEGSEGNLVDDADIVIIGSGITGVSAAYHLARNLNSGGSPSKVVILEARDFCSGATGRNGGHLTAEIFDNFVFRETRFGPEEAKKTYKLEIHTEHELVDLIKSQGWEDTVDLVSNYRVGLLKTDDEIKVVKDDIAAAKAAGAALIDKVEWLDEAEMASQYGTSYPGYRHPGNNIWPLKLVTQLFNLSKTLNPDLTLHTNTPVTSISPAQSSSHRRWTLTTPRGTITSSYIIHATNAYASYLLPHLHGPKGIIPTRGQAIALRAAASSAVLTKDAWVGTLGWKYWFPRPTQDENENPLIIFGGGRDSSGPRLESYIVDDSTVNEDVGKDLRSYLPPLFPGKYEVGREPEMEWTGIMGYTQVGDPFVGPVIVPSCSDLPADYYKGHYIAAGFTGHGMPRGYACAEAVVGMIKADLTHETWIAPDWFPRHFLTSERL